MRKRSKKNLLLSGHIGGPAPLSIFAPMCWDRVPAVHLAYRNPKMLDEAKINTLGIGTLTRDKFRRIFNSL